MRTGLMILIMTPILFLNRAAIANSNEIEELKKQLLELQKRIEQLEAKQKQQDQQIVQQDKQILQQQQVIQQQNQQIEQQVAKVVEEKKVGGIPESIKWVENIRLFGDFRYRFENIEAENDNRPDRFHNRIRARVGLMAKINPELDLGFRLATGSGDPVSTNQTLGDSFSKKDINLDWAYFDWHPAAAAGLNVLGGKFATPFYRVGKNQLIWDDDLSMEGIAATYKLPLNELDELFVNSGGFWVDESDTGVDTSLWGAQAGLKHYFDGEKKKQYVLGGASWYSYGNIEGQPSLQSTWSTGTSFFGNTSAGGEFVNDYDIVELFGEYGFEMCNMPMLVFGNYVQNTSAVTSGDTGWLVGKTINRAKDPGSWEINYDYRDLEADAVVGALSDSDFIGGGTNGKGHRFNFTYQLVKNIQTALSYYLDERGSNDDDYRRLQADVIFKF